MRREAWLSVMRRLDAVKDYCPPKCTFSDAAIVQVYLWSVFHDRPVFWACQRQAWPGRPRPLPTPSTMTRRLRTLSVMKMLRTLIPRCSDTKLLCIDGMPLEVSSFSKDKQAKGGWGAGRRSRGYKVHAIVNRRGQLAAFTVRPMNEAECTVGRRLISRSSRQGSLIVADSSYDSNPLYQLTASTGGRLLAPRRKSKRSISTGHKQHEHRLANVELLEPDHNRHKKRQVSRLRAAIERYFGWLAMSGGGQLPPWVRTLRRVSRWVTAKIAIHAVSSAA